MIPSNTGLMPSSPGERTAECRNRVGTLSGVRALLYLLNALKKSIKKKKKKAKHKNKSVTHSHSARTLVQSRNFSSFLLRLARRQPRQARARARCSSSSSSGGSAASGLDGNISHNSTAPPPPGHMEEEEEAVRPTEEEAWEVAGCRL